MKTLIRWLKLFNFYASGEAYDMTDEEILERLAELKQPVELQK